MTRFVQLVLLAATAGLQAAPIFWAIGPDQNTGVPNQLVRIDPGNNTLEAFPLGDGVQGFGGGIYGPTSGVFLGFRTSDGSAYNFAVYDTANNIVDAPVSPVNPPTGLTVIGENAVWLETDFLGVTSLAGIPVNTSDPIGVGFNGLAYRTTDSLLYSIQNGEDAGVPFSVLHSIDLDGNTNPIATLVLGYGFLGGLAWDPATDRFYALRVELNNSLPEWFNTTLWSFALTDLVPTLEMDLQQFGYTFSALTVDASDVPEPAGWLLAGAGLLALGAMKRKRA